MLYYYTAILAIYQPFPKKFGQKHFVSNKKETRLRSEVFSLERF